MCKCNIEGCENQAVAKGMCMKHYQQIRLKGKIFESYRGKSNPIEYFEDHAEIIILDKNHNEKIRTLIDLDDVDRVKNIKWGCINNRNKNFYIETSNKSVSNRRLHRFIMNAIEGEYVDHINRNTLDNRKCNLRICTNQQNICNCDLPKNNKSGCKGVYWSKDKNKWTVQITINNKTKYIGRYDDYEQAVKARIAAAKQYYGNFANDEEILEYN
jgi:hypothetical protein